MSLEDSTHSPYDFKEIENQLGKEAHALARMVAKAFGKIGRGVNAAEMTEFAADEVAAGKARFDLNLRTFLYTDLSGKTGRFAAADDPLTAIMVSWAKEIHPKISGAENVTEENIRDGFMHFGIGVAAELRHRDDFSKLELVMGKADWALRRLEKRKKRF